MKAKETRRKAPAADAAFREARKSGTVPVLRCSPVYDLLIRLDA